MSPLSRALETAAIAMDKVWNDVSVPKVAVEMSRERYGKNTCDKRRSVTELRQKWPMVDFDHFMNAEEDIWCVVYYEACNLSYSTHSTVVMIQ